MSLLPGIGLAQWRQQSDGFSFNGHAVRFWAAGSGQPLLLIHGFPSASWDWHRLWQALSQRYQVIACDMLGFGLSDKPKQHQYSLLEQADLQQALLAHLKISEPVHLLAHDYGDSVAQELLARHQEGRLAVASCAFLNGGLFPETHRPVLLQRLLLSPVGPLLSRFFTRQKLAVNFARIFGPQTPPSAAEIEAIWRLLEYNQGRQVMHKLITYMPERIKMRERWLAAMQAKRVPMRVIDGAADPISGVHMVERYCELIESPDTVLLEGIGHYPQLEAPEKVLEHYLHFRQRLEANSCSDAHSLKAPPLLG